MKFTATTSSLLFASMALSPSLASAAPIGMEASTSPNPAGSHFNPSPRFPESHNIVGSSPKMNRAPARRTGPGSPRRSIPFHMLNVHSRGSPLDVIDPVTGMLEPVRPMLGSLKSVAGPLLDPVSKLPITGTVVSKVGVGLGLSGPDVTGQSQPDIAASASAAPQIGGENLSVADNEFPGSTLPLPFDLPVDQDGLNDLPGFIGSPQQIAGLPFSDSLRNPFDEVAGRSSGTLPPSGSTGYDGLPSLNGLLPNLPGYVSTPTFRGDMSTIGGIAEPYLPHPANVPQAAKGVAPQAHWQIIGETADGQFVEASADGAMRLLPIPNPANAVSVESVPASPPSSPASSVSGSFAPPALHTQISGTSSSTQHTPTPSSLPAHSLTAVASSAAVLSFASSATQSEHSSTPVTLPTPTTLSTAGNTATPVPSSSTSALPTLAPPPLHPSVQQVGQVIEFAPEEVKTAHLAVGSSSDLPVATSVVNAAPSPAVVRSTLTSTTASIETGMHSLPTPTTLSTLESSNTATG